MKRKEIYLLYVNVKEVEKHLDHVVIPAGQAPPWCLGCNDIRQEHISPIDIVVREDAGLIFQWCAPKPGPDFARERVVALMKREMPNLIVGDVICKKPSVHVLKTFFMSHSNRVRLHGAAGSISYTKCKTCGSERMSSVPCTYGLASDFRTHNMWYTQDHNLLVSEDGRKMLEPMMDETIRFKKYPLREELRPADAVRKPVVLE